MGGGGSHTVAVADVDEQPKHKYSRAIVVSSCPRWHFARSVTGTELVADLGDLPVTPCSDSFAFPALRTPFGQVSLQKVAGCPPDVVAGLNRSSGFARPCL